MGTEYSPDSLLAWLTKIADPRRREGRRYGLAPLLGLVVLGALHGHDSLRGIWVWARYHWRDLWEPLGFGSPHFPAYNTVRDLLARLDADEVDRIVRVWLEQVVGHPIRGVSADGKVLRGSRRVTLPGLAVVGLVGHELKVVLAQAVVPPGGSELQTLLRLLREVPLTGRVVTLDAGLMSAETTQVITEGEGDYLGVVKGNHGEVKWAVDEWVAEDIFPLSAAPSDAASARRRTSQATGDLAAPCARRPNRRKIARTPGGA